jgi:hypothetical protein
MGNKNSQQVDEKEQPRNVLKRLVIGPARENILPWDSPQKYLEPNDIDIEKYIEQLEKNGSKNAHGDSNWLTGYRDSLNQIRKELGYRPKYRYSSSPCGDKNLVLYDVYVGYKVARFTHKWRGLSLKVAVLLTLYVPSKETKVMMSHTNTVVEPNKTGFKNNVEYCCGTVIVAAMQFIGGPSDVITTYNKYVKGEGGIVSNFDPNFKYQVSHKIVEPDFGSDGVGCVQGIHFFSTKQAAVRYAKLKGFIGDAVLTSTISAPYYHERETDIEEYKSYYLSGKKLGDDSIVYNYTEDLKKEMKDEMDLMDKFIKSVKFNTLPDLNRLDAEKLFGKPYLAHNGWYREVRKENNAIEVYEEKKKMAAAEEEKKKKMLEEERKKIALAIASAAEEEKKIVVDQPAAVGNKRKSPSREEMDAGNNDDNKVNNNDDVEMMDVDLRNMEIDDRRVVVENQALIQRNSDLMKRKKRTEPPGGPVVE